MNTSASSADQGTRHCGGRWLRHLLPATVSIGALLVLWQAAVDLGHISERTLASPTQIVTSMVQTWPDLMQAAETTSYETLLGFGIAVLTGVVLGIGLYSSKTLYQGIYPLLVAAQTIPLITIAPLFMLWFGFEPTGKIVLVAVLGLFPIAIQTCRGLIAVPRFYEDVALTCGAGRIWTLWHVKLYVAARQIFGGIRISAAYAFGTAVTAEYLGATSGYGIWLQGAFNSFRTPPIFSATLLIVAETGVLLGVVSLVEWLILGSADDDNSFDGTH